MIFLSLTNLRHVQQLTETRRLGLGPVVPGLVRNDLFVTVVRGTFDKGLPGLSGRNIEVSSRLQRDHA